MKLKKDVRAIDLSVKRTVQKRLKTFASFKRKSPKAWFSELCFCILAANAKSQTSWNIQKEVGYDGFMTLDHPELSATILRNKHRFHNNKAKYIIEARKHAGIKQTVQQLVSEEGTVAARLWLAKHVKGFGLKEASHYLRNVGYFDFAVLDRHVVNVMLEYGVIKRKPKSITPKKYFSLEKKFQKLAREMDMSCAELDFYFWYMRAGKVLK